MQITWLGQAGLLFEKEDLTILVDPYLSDSVKKVNPNNYRRVPVDERFFDKRPDIIICTHDHMDHNDPETMGRFLSQTEKSITVLASAAAYKALLPNKNGHNYVCFTPHTVWSQNGIRITAVKAVHSEPTAIGVIIEEIGTPDGKVYYITGDTLYNSEIFTQLPENIDAVFLPVNGVGNNMNMTDAIAFAKRTGAKKAVPLHFGMFDSIDPRLFACENRVIPRLFEKIPV